MWRTGYSPLLAGLRPRRQLLSRRARLGALLPPQRRRQVRCFAASGGDGLGPSLMDASCLSETQAEVREAVFRVCSDFPDEYWARRDDSGEYPLDFHQAIARAGFIGCALPEELGGAGLGISEAIVVLQTIAESGAGFAGAQTIHANVYATQPIARFGTPAQREAILPRIVSGEWRTCFGVTEPDAGLDTLSLATRAERSADGRTYRITGQKIWISSAQVADRMVLLARTSPSPAEGDEKEGRGTKLPAGPRKKRSAEGLSLFCIPLDRAAPGLTMRRIAKMGGRAVDANEVFFDGYEVSAEETLLGGSPAGEGRGFAAVLHGMNAERCLIAGEALGLGYAALRRAAAYARQRVVFGRPVGAYQGVAHPLADAWMRLEAAKLATYRAGALYDEHRRREREKEARGGEGEEDRQPPEVGLACNAAKYLAAEAAFAACEAAVLSMGGMGYAREFHVERYLRECLVPRIAPVSREMIKNFVAERALGLPRSY